jgi:hypothetical protein
MASCSRLLDCGMAGKIQVGSGSSHARSSRLHQMLPRPGFMIVCPLFSAKTITTSGSIQV